MKIQPRLLALRCAQRRYDGADGLTEAIFVCRKSESSIPYDGKYTDAARLPPLTTPALVTGPVLFAVLGAAGFEGVQLFAGLEANRLAGSNADFGAGTWIAPDAGLACADAEDTKSAQFDAFASGESLFQSLEDRVDGGLRLGSGQTGALDNVMDNVLLDQGGTSLDHSKKSTASYACDTTGFAPGGKPPIFAGADFVRDPRRHSEAGDELRTGFPKTAGGASLSLARQVP